MPLDFARDLRPRTIVDPIHGQIRLTDAELAVVDHALFRRLARIRQNGLLYFVFPSASHHRFEHSLGVLHVADAMLEHLWFNSFVARQKRAVTEFVQTSAPLTDRLSDASAGVDRGINPTSGEIADGTQRPVSTSVAIDLSQVPQKVLRWLVRVTRFAALVHDLGHGPLSHTFDSFALERDALAHMLKENVLPALTAIATQLANWERRGSPGAKSYDLVPHEVMSCVLFAEIWRDVCDDAREQSQTSTDRDFSNTSQDPGEEVEDARQDPSLPITVAAAILGMPELAANVLSPERAEWLPLIHDLIASAPADADRMDYLERDSRSIGVTYGLFDRGRVLKSFLCYRETDDSGQHYRLGIKRSGLAALENFVQARYELFVQVYLHKTNQAVSQMLDQIATEAKRDGVRLFNIDRGNPTGSFKNVIEQYLALGDDVFLRALRGLEPSILPAPPDVVKQLADAVEKRQLWKRLYEGDATVVAAVHENLVATLEFAAVCSDIILEPSDPKATKDLDKGAALLTRGPDGIYATVSGQNWYRASIIIGALHRAERSIGRIYVRGTALEPSIFESLLAKVRAIAIGLEQKHEREQQDTESMIEALAKLSRAGRVTAELRAQLEIPNDSLVGYSSTPK